MPHADTDDYFWVPTDPPYVRQRPVEERLALMEAVFLPREAWVLSGSMGGWGEPVFPRCDAIVFLTLDPAERLARLRAREERRRAASGVDEEQFAAFLTWAAGYDDPEFAGRSRAGQEAWLATLTTPVLRLDGARPTTELVDAVLAWEPPQP